MTTLADRIVEASGLSQSEVARRAGMPASLVSSYVRGRRSPSASQVERLADAAGVRIDVSRRLPRPGPLVNEHRDRIVAAARERGYSAIYVFGSVARGEDVEGSDADFLVEGGSAPTIGFFGSPIYDLADDLALLLGLEVDVLPLDAATPAAVRSEMRLL